MAWSRNLKKDIIINLPNQMTHIKRKVTLHKITRSMRQTKSINRNTLSYFVLPTRHEENNCKTGTKIKSEFICHMI